MHSLVTIAYSVYRREDVREEGKKGLSPAVLKRGTYPDFSKLVSFLSEKVSLPYLTYPLFCILSIHFYSKSLFN